MRAATEIYAQGNDKDNISIHAAHAGCDVISSSVFLDDNISIHAAHAGCDMMFSFFHSLTNKISIHAAHAGCDLFYICLLS